MLTTINKTFFLLFFFTFCSNFLLAQKSNPWTKISESSVSKSVVERQIIPNKYETFELDIAALQNILNAAPMRFSAASKAGNVILTLPLPDGSFEQFRIVEAPIMQAGLANKYPNMRTYAGQGIEDPTAYLRCDITHKGFRAMVLSARHSTLYIDPYAVGDTKNYVAYFKKDYQKSNALPFSCEVVSANEPEDAPFEKKSEFEKKKENNPVPSLSKSSDCQLRTYRLALACTGEYATYHGGTVADVMAEFVVAMNRINGIYERDATITMVMVDNTDELIYLNGATDPYTNNNGGTMLNQNQNTCDNVIGSTNYDIGHVFSTGGGGIAQLNAPCGGGKARGVTGLGNPINDPFYVDYVSHEMGHQYGGNHTQNNSCNRNNSTAMEPGSASTIMGYAGICAPNVQNNSDDHFHAISLDEIDAFVTFGNGSTCPEITPSGNTAPTAAVSGAFYNLPVSTPFALTCDASDGDGDVLTYCWEQMNNQVANMPPEPTNTGGPAFRSNSPVESSTRYFPNLNAIVNNQTPTWEVLPSVSRSMAFRCTVRDNFLGAGCQADVDVDLSFTASAGPFLVTNPNVNLTWLVTNNETVTWDVANTDLAPVSCGLVDILLSTDGGFSYPITVASGVPNNGTYELTVPNNPTTTARIKVVCSDNIFFDISNQDFIIELPPVPTFILGANPDYQAVCPTDMATYDLDFTSISGFAESINLSVAGLPAGASASFSDNPFSPPGIATLTISDIATIAPGIYNLTVNADATSIFKEVMIDLEILPIIEDAVVLGNPMNGASGVFPNASLTWTSISGATFYSIEIATSPAFGGSLIESGTAATNSYQPQNANGTAEVYYWRVQAKNPCSEGPFSEIFAFQTLSDQEECFDFTANDLPLTIPDDETGTWSSLLDIDDDFLVSSASTSVNIDHTWTGDLTAEIESPSGLIITLFDQPGFPATDFGCAEDNIVASFYDNAPNTADDFENTCNNPPPSIEGDFQPNTPLSDLNGENSSGTWSLHISDAFDADGGTLNNWDLTLCKYIPAPSAELLTNNILTVAQGAADFISQTYLEIADPTPNMVVYTIMSLPEFGDLYLDNGGMVLLNIGDNFTQENINSNQLSYQHDDSNTTSDDFLFDVLDGDNGWLSNQTFLINIVVDDLSATAVLVNDIDCNNANNGEISVATNGGAAPLTYSLDGNNFQSSNLFENLPQGIYSITVKDGNGFTFTTNEIIITNPPILTASANVMDNIITVNASGGIGNLTYSLDGMNFQSSNVFNDLDNGIYTITVMDENGCTMTTEATVAFNSLVVSVQQVNQISCFGGMNGSILVNVSGGAIPYSFSLNGGNFQSSNLFEDLGIDDYTITVQDGDGFTIETNTLSLFQPSQIMASTDVVGNDLTVNGSGGTGNLQYSIDGVNFQTSNVFNDLDNGTYIITVMDENDCTTTTQAIVAINTLIVSAEQISLVSCFGGNDGSIEVAVGGGATPFMYSLDGSNFQSSNLFENLGNGNYEITVQDADGFTAISNTVSITQPTQITANAVPNGYDIVVSASGGTGNLQYSLDGINFQSSNVFPNVGNGNYVITIQDENGCEITVVVTVNVPSIEIFVQGGDITLPSCFNSSDGSLTISATGGVPPYQYSLNNGPFQNDNTFTNLSANTHDVTVMDSGGYSIDGAITIANPELIVASANVVNYEIVVDASGGTGSLQYSIDGINFQTSNIFSDLPNGDYTITVVDENGCTMTTMVTLNIAPITLNVSILNGISCAGTSDGSLMLEVNGGVPPYQYSLNGSDFQDDPVFENISGGMITIDIIDAGGAMFSSSFTLSEPLPIQGTASVFGHQITVDAFGGTGMLQFSLDGINFQSSNIFEDIENGNYTVTVQDENGCVYEIQLTVNAPVQISFDLINPLCFGANNGGISVLSVDGGFMPFEYSLNGGDFSSTNTWNNLPAGEYTITVIDVTGFEFTAPSVILETPTQIDVTTALNANNLTIDANGGTGDLMYSIDGGMTFQEENVFNNLPNGTYDIIVIDENDCTVETTVEVDVSSVFATDLDLQFTILPNPNNGIFSLILEEKTNKELTIRLFDAAGKLIFEDLLLKEGMYLKTVIDLENIATGVYQLQVTDGALFGTKRVVILE